MELEGVARRAIDRSEGLGGSLGIQKTSPSWTTGTVVGVGMGAAVAVAGRSAWGS